MGELGKEVPAVSVHRCLVPPLAGWSTVLCSPRWEVPALPSPATRRSRALLCGFAVQLSGKVAVRGQRLSARWGLACLCVCLCTAGRVAVAGCAAPCASADRRAPCPAAGAGQSVRPGPARVVLRGGRRRSPAQRGGSSARKTLCGPFVRREPRLVRAVLLLAPIHSGWLRSASIFIYRAGVLITHAVESSLAVTCFHDNGTPRSLRGYLFARFSLFSCSYWYRILSPGTETSK